MRKLNYKVRKVDGTEFHTTSYKEATENANRIIETYLTPVDTKTKEEKEIIEKRLQKNLAYWKKKKEFKK